MDAVAVSSAVTERCMLPTGRASRPGTAPSLVSYDWITRRYIRPSAGRPSALTSARTVPAASPSVVAARSASHEPAATERVLRGDLAGLIDDSDGVYAIFVPTSWRHLGNDYAKPPRPASGALVRVSLQTERAPTHRDPADPSPTCPVPCQSTVRVSRPERTCHDRTITP